MGVLLARHDDHTLQFTAQRGKKGSNFEAAQLDLTEKLGRHIRKSVQINSKIKRLNREKQSMQSALERMRMGVILVSAQGTLHYANREAERLLAQGDGIMCLAGRIVLDSSLQTNKLYQHIAQAVHAGPKRGGDMRITRRNGGALQCVIVPVNEETAWRWNLAEHNPHVVIFLSSPGQLTLAPERLAQLYKITPAEARLAAKLSAMKSVKEAAIELNISDSTARHQLKSIFAKTGTSSQSELMVLLATGAATVDSGEVA